MDVDVLDKLSQAGVAVWLDQDGKLRINSDAPAELKELVRTHKQDLIDVCKAQAIMNRPGMRCIRLPLSAGGSHLRSARALCSSCIGQDFKKRPCGAAGMAVPMCQHVELTFR